MIDFELDIEGWIKLPRSIMTEPWWQEKPFSKCRALLDLLFRSTFKARREIEHCGKKMILVRGQAFIQYRELVRRWGWSRNKIKRFLKDLEKKRGDRFAIDREIVNKSCENPKERPSAIGVIITFINFERICPE